MTGSAVLQVIAALVEIFFMVYLLMAYTTKRRTDNKVINYLFGMAMIGLGIFYNCVIVEVIDVWDMSPYIVSMSCILVTILVLSRDSIKRKLIAFVMLVVPSVLLEILYEIYLYLLLGITAFTNSDRGPYFLNYNRMFMEVCDITMYTIIILWHNRKQVKNVVIPILLLALLPLMQLIYLTLIFRNDLAQDMTYAMMAGIGALVFNTAINILFIRFIASNDKLYEREKEEELKANLAHLDKRYFETMEQELSETDKIKKDILKRIGEIKANIESGKTGSNEELMNKIGTDVDKMTGMHFCEEATVDMVLTLKMRKAESLDIPMSVKAVVPGDVNISKLDLSSVVSNLADNAIESAATYKESGSDPYVNLNIAKKGELLVIRTENPTVSSEVVDDITKLSTTKDNPIGVHGYGLKILRNIARRYDGELTVDIRDHVSVFTMMLNCSEGERV